MAGGRAAGRAGAAGRLAGRVYYGWVVVGLTAAALLVSAGVRSAPGVLLTPLEEDLGWSRSAISFAVSVGLVLFGLSGPAVGALMDRVGPRRLLAGGLALISASTLAGATMDALWQLNLYWGVLGGIGTGIVGTVLGATVANRWFVERRGLVVGVFGAATSAGFLVFVPLLVWLEGAVGWRGAVVVLAVCAAALVAPALLLMRDDPAALGLRAYGAPPVAVASMGPTPPAAGARATMRAAVRTPEFWLLAGSFFVCGATSNGLIGTHFVAHSVDHGISEGTAAGALALMGGMNFVGTLASGWLTDRHDPRRLLAVYYTFRGLSLFFLPLADGFGGLAVFAVLFGLDYIATVPPTAALTADIFGRRNVGTVFGWVFCAHQVGAAAAAWAGGLTRDALGDYTVAFLAAGVLAVLGGLMALRIDPTPRVRPEAAGAGA